MRQSFVFLLALILILSACVSPSSAKQASGIQVMDAWVRTVSGMKGMSGSNTALFMTIKNNGGGSDKLVKVESDSAEMIQIHLSEMDANNVSSMHEVDGVDIPAGSIIELKPGGYHIMLMGLQHDIKEGDKITFTLTFQNAGQVIIEASVKTP